MIAYEWGKFVWWLYHANPEAVATILAIVVSAGVTVFLAFFTFLNVRASSRQTRAMLQPALKIDTTFHNDPKHPKYDASGVAPGTSESGIGSLEILNVGTNPVVLLDVRCSANPFGMPAVVKQVGSFDEQILYADSHHGVVIPFDFTGTVSEETRRRLGFGYEFRVVASDLSRQIWITYVLHPVLGRRTHYIGGPWRVRLKYKSLGMKRVYYHVKHEAMVKFSRFREKS